MVLGAGVGGYPVAIKLAGKGYRVAVVEEDKLGGECTNYGCVPSKALYHIARSLEAVNKVLSTRIGVDPRLLREWIESRVKQARDGLAYLFERYGIDLYSGHGVIAGPYKVRVKDTVLETKYLVVATGTDPGIPPGIVVDGEHVVTNREIFYQDPPGSMLVIGGGAIGVELAYSYSCLGTRVYIVEALNRILPFLDRDVSIAVERYLRERGVAVYKNRVVEAITKTSGSIEARLSSGEKLCVERVVVATGRKPRTKGIGLGEAGVELNEKGYIVLKNSYYTSTPWILASGDVTGPPLLAHKAFLDAEGVVETILHGKASRPKLESIPLTIFSGLEVASIGYTEEQLKREGIEYKRAKLPVSYLSAIAIKGGGYSFVKILYKDNHVYGVHLVAPNASEVIASFIPYYLGALGFKEAKYIAYPHLTVSEIVREFAEYLLGEPVHIYIKK